MTAEGKEGEAGGEEREEFAAACAYVHHTVAYRH